MSQTGVLYISDIGRTVSFPVTKSSATTITSARLMVRPAGASTSIEWTVAISAQTSTQITLEHVLDADSLPSAGTYRWRAFFYDAGVEEIDSTDEHTINIRAAGVSRPA